jgi:hypothetical protein
VRTTLEYSVSASAYRMAPETDQTQVVDDTAMPVVVVALGASKALV